MIRAIGIALVLFAGPVFAGEAMDCFNDEHDTGSRYTHAEPEVLRVTDADMADLMRRIRESESRDVAARDESTMNLSLADNPPTSD